MGKWGQGLHLYHSSSFLPPRVFIECRLHTHPAQVQNRKEQKEVAVLGASVRDEVGANSSLWDIETEGVLL